MPVLRARVRARIATRESLPRPAAPPDRFRAAARAARVVAVAHDAACRALRLHRPRAGPGAVAGRRHRRRRARAAVPAAGQWLAAPRAAPRRAGRGGRDLAAGAVLPAAAEGARRAPLPAARPGGDHRGPRRRAGDRIGRTAAHGRGPARSRAAHRRGRHGAAQRDRRHRQHGRLGRDQRAAAPDAAHAHAALRRRPGPGAGHRAHAPGRQRAGFRPPDARAPGRDRRAARGAVRAGGNDALRPAAAIPPPAPAHRLRGGRVRRPAGPGHARGHPGRSGRRIHHPARAATGADQPPCRRQLRGAGGPDAARDQPRRSAGTCRPTARGRCRA